MRLKCAPFLDTTMENTLRQDMWNRLGPDEKLYERSASMVFNLLLSVKEIYGETSQGMGLLPLISLGMDDEILSRFGRLGKPAISLQELNTKVSETMQTAMTNCAGMIEITADHRSDPERPWWHSTSCRVQRTEPGS